MNSGVVLPATEEILAATRCVDDGVHRVLGARDRVIPWMGKYEAPIEALSLIYLVIRHAEAVGTLARGDLVMLPSALVVTRAAFETSARSQWLVYPKEVYAREARWLAHMKSEENASERLGKLTAVQGSTDHSLGVRAAEIQKFREAVSERLPPHIKRIDALPNLRAILVELGEEAKYAAYIHLSQFSHGAYHASSFYRDDPWKQRVLREAVGPLDWAPVLELTWWALSSASRRLFRNVKRGRAALRLDDLDAEMEGRITAIRVLAMNPSAPKVGARVECGGPRRQ